MRRVPRPHPPATQNARPGRIAPGPGLGVARLNPFLRRAVLTTDGTVTNLIETFLEPVVVDKLAEERVAAPVPDWPELKPGTALIRRTVLIRGARTGQIFLHAESLLVLELLAPTIRRELLTTDKPIGKVIREHRLESYRDLLGSRSEEAGPRAHVLGVDPTAALVARTYRIHFNGRAAIQITERFLAAAVGEVEGAS